MRGISFSLFRDIIKKCLASRAWKPPPDLGSEVLDVRSNIALPGLQGSTVLSLDPPGRSCYNKSVMKAKRKVLNYPVENIKSRDEDIPKPAQAIMTSVSI